MELPLSIVTIRVPFRLLTMMFFMIAPNILRLIVILFDSMLPVVLFIYFLLLPPINLLIFSPRLILLGASVILSPNSTWSMPTLLEFAGGY
ncbi:hypothetical protein LOK49_LG11G01905 [Camellia lanceoleosa]|uniref:Uncharacterized protein n=1 Tax=Camellia lanceoleosa TaxID=1840588 RepID=A0ACC0FWZ9_9ERIC|nr:hypothetical protein LOK49_LG11G01905 [Camellia lanceoleosa]